MFKYGFSDLMAREITDMLKRPSWSEPWVKRAIAERHKRLVGWYRKGLTMKKGWKRGTTGQV